MTIFGKIIIKILSIFFGALLLTFTATETYAFLLSVTGVPLIAAVGLIMFEGGFLYWALEFKQNAEGLLQMAIALLTSLLDFAAVLAAVALRLGAFDANILGPATGPKVVVAAVLVNLAAKYAYELAHPDNTKNIYKRASEGLILLRTFTAFSQKTDDIAEGLADEMAVSWADDLRRELTFRHKALTHSNPTPLPAPQGSQDIIQNGQPVTPARRPFFDLSRFSFLRPTPAPPKPPTPTPAAQGEQAAYQAIVDRYTKGGWGFMGPDDIAKEFNITPDQAYQAMQKAHDTVFGSQPQPNGQPGGKGANHPT